MKKADWNDVHVAVGLDAVRDLLRTGLAAANDTPAPPACEEPPPWDDCPEPAPLAPSDYEATLTLTGALARYTFMYPTGKVWDEHAKVSLKKTVARDLMGKALFDEWTNHADRRQIHDDLVKPLAAKAAATGGGGLAGALGRYVYLYPTAEAWDLEARQKVPISSLRFAIADCFDDWIKHPGRRQLDIENLVFDPEQKADPATHVNRFRGLPLTPARDDDKCRYIRELLLHLCNQDALVFDWLTCWLAYPLQHVGAKMATAIVMHSPTEGTGKSLFFEGVMRRIYGEYGITLGQHELESQYNAWISGKLYGLFEEVLARDQKYNQMGLVKHLITGETVHISQKFVTGWEERNHVNLVFLSNEIVPMVISDSDRRSMVINPDTTLPFAEQRAVQRELDNGGAEAWYAYLLAYPLRDFNPHSKPLMTDAKRDLVDACRASWDVFAHNWLDGSLGLPVVPCLSDDLFKAYRSWADKGRENVVSRNKFSSYVSKVCGVTRRQDAWRSDGQNRVKGTLFVPAGKDTPEGESQEDYYGKCVKIFDWALSAGD